MEIELFSVVRALHLLTAALWLGAGALLTLYIMPAVRSSGAAGGSVMAVSMRRGLGAFMASVAGLTILSGLVLFWMWSHARGPGAMHGAGAMLLSLGALAGIAAAIVGGAVLGRASHELARLAGAPADDAATQARIAALHRRGAAASKVTLVLLVAALLLMIFSHSF
jgi:hypothetical protein